MKGKRQRSEVGASAKEETGKRVEIIRVVRGVQGVEHVEVVKIVQVVQIVESVKIVQLVQIVESVKGVQDEKSGGKEEGGNHIPPIQIA